MQLPLTRRLPTLSNNTVNGSKGFKNLLASGKGGKLTAALSKANLMKAETTSDNLNEEKGQDKISMLTGALSSTTKKDTKSKFINNLINGDSLSAGLEAAKAQGMGSALTDAEADIPKCRVCRHKMFRGWGFLYCHACSDASAICDELRFPLLTRLLGTFPGYKDEDSVRKPLPPTEGGMAGSRYGNQGVTTLAIKASTEASPF